MLPPNKDVAKLGAVHIREWGDDDMGGTIGGSIVDRGNADAMGVAVDCDRG